jgi:tRNA-dihydrouridine synthase B
VRAVKIPVVANGDVKDATHAEECIKITGAAGVMLGRALVGAPWRISTSLRGGATKQPSIQNIILYHLSHADNIIEMRKHLVAYASHLPDSKELKKRLATVQSFEEAKNLITHQ